MNSKNIKISYQSVKTGLTFVLFILIASYFVGKYKHVFIISEKEFLQTSGLEVTSIILGSGILIWLAFLIFGAMIGGIYKLFSKDEKWYATLTHYNIKIPITMKQYESIKDNKIFFTKYPHDQNPIFSYDELKKWAEKIIEKELIKSNVGGKQK